MPNILIRTTLQVHSSPEDTSILGPPYQPTKLYVGYVYRPGGGGGTSREGEGGQPTGVRVRGMGILSHHCLLGVYLPRDTGLFHLYRIHRAIKQPGVAIRLDYPKHTK